MLVAQRTTEREGVTWHQTRDLGNRVFEDREGECNGRWKAKPPGEEGGRAGGN
jgi:hypothetical protein